MEKRFSHILFERYADDIIVHCRTKAQAEMIFRAIGQRLTRCRLQLNTAKTKIVYCKDVKRKQEYPEVSFDFLGFSFKPRTIRLEKTGRVVQLFLPALSLKARTAMLATAREWEVPRRTNTTLEQFAKEFNPVLRGWVNYYGRFGGNPLGYVWYCVNRSIIRWARKRFKKLNKSYKRARRFIKCISRRQPELFAHWLPSRAFGLSARRAV